MKKSWRALGAIALGVVFLTICGKGQAEAVSGVQPAEAEDTGTENHGQSGQEESGEKILLTLGTMGTDPRLENAVEAYNAQSGKYYVKIIDYLPEEYDCAVREAAEDRFRMDLAVGNGIDIVSLSGQATDELGYTGALMDLNAFLTMEDRQDKYVGNILECAQTGATLYEISPVFVLAFMIGDGSRIGMENGWTLEEMLDSFERNGKDGSALGKGGVRTVARLLQYSIEDYVDWETGTADFCNEEFYDVLRFGKEADSGEYVYPTRESLASGTHLASCELLVSGADMQYFNWLFGDNMVVKGYPSNYGTGVAVRLEGSMGISSYSRYPEGAWDFLEFYVGGTWTEREFYVEETLIREDFFDVFHGGFPLNRKLFEEKLERSMVKRYMDTGEPVAMRWAEGGTPDFYANTAEDVEKLRELIALADRRSLSGQSVIIRMIEEEVSGYNAGILTAEQTAEKIQNRVQSYLDEQK
ncbi:MAG: hypothetical protein HDR11_05925 [Lachnospiraceae bacterium]|nr:hypothetical protein [Lachnospiraceae bacterium]